MKIGIDLQHHGIPNKPSHTGFIAPDGSRNGPESEYWWIAQYGAGLCLRLMQHGHKTFMSSAQYYSQRGEFYKDLGCELVLICHVNKGGGLDGRFYLDHRTSESNKASARKMVSWLKDMSWPSQVKIASPDYAANAYNVQQGYPMKTMVLEPFFADNQVQVDRVHAWTHQKALLRGPTAFGAFIADAINHGYK